MVLILCILFFGCLGKGHSKMESFIVDGENTRIEKYPHSAFLDVSCEGEWTCGSSIVNQFFVLTAAHCIYGCNKRYFIWVVVGSNIRNRGLKTAGIKFQHHSNYNEMTMEADIGLVRVKTQLPLQSGIMRVILMKQPPVTSSDLYVAGWGLKDESRGISSNVLKETKQKLVSRMDCVRVIKKLPPGSICAKGNGYASSGDSGSALVFDGSFQIGLVSYKIMAIRRDLVVYTDVRYYYDWISAVSRQLYCSQ